MPFLEHVAGTEPDTIRAWPAAPDGQEPALTRAQQVAAAGRPALDALWASHCATATSPTPQQCAPSWPTPRRCAPAGAGGKDDAKLRWTLSADEAEAAAMREVAAGCPGQTVTYELAPQEGLTRPR
ncbi:hypothetical protein ACF07F_34760 [Streptomyces sp. NPDC015237]|uniref:hypothetical protein n=1 Tax=Streptomyces sp. NPDC015237 TaxID=3364949 RepID=UPI0036FBB25B